MVKYYKTTIVEMIQKPGIVILLLQGIMIAAMTNPSIKRVSNCQYKIYGCTKMVRPMLNEVRYMFPTSMTDVDTMCKTWSHFVDCVRRYMASCSTQEQRSKFNKAVGHSVDTVHAICSSDRHQTDYLDSAHCFRRVSVDSCGFYYRRLISQVANRGADDTHICCAYGQFKTCVSAPLLRNCGMKVHSLLDHSLSYLVSTCSSTFYPMSYKCPTAPPVPLPVTSPLVDATHVPTTFVMEIETSTTTSVVTSISKPRTIIYPLPPTHGSRTSGTVASTGNYFIIMWFIVLQWSYHLLMNLL